MLLIAPFLHALPVLIWHAWCGSSPPKGPAHAFLVSVLYAIMSVEVCSCEDIQFSITSRSSHLWAIGIKFTSDDLSAVHLFTWNWEQHRCRTAPSCGYNMCHIYYWTWFKNGWVGLESQCSIGLHDKRKICDIGDQYCDCNITGVAWTNSETTKKNFLFTATV